MGRHHFRFDWITVILFFCLGLFGLFVLLTVNPGLFTQQLIYFGIGFLLLFALSTVDPAFLWWFAPIGYILGNLFLVLSYFGPNIRGATRWILIGNAQLQPSEIVKPLIILALARFMAQYPPRHVRYVPIHLLLFLLPFVLVFRQPDLGSSLVYASFWFAMLLAGGFPLGMFIASIAGGTLLLPVLWQILAGYQKARILTFLNPSLDPKGAGYNALQAMIAVGSGQLFGRGLGRGTQSHLRFLPEFHTDFIFATLVEELGFLGGLLLFLGYAALLWRIISPLIRGLVKELFPFTYIIGVFAMLLSQIVINTGMNMGIIPITGITLPLISYGGSSILSIAVSIGLLWALRQDKRETESVAIH